MNISPISPISVLFRDMLTDYRYPGSRSFLDTDLDRKLFFGRDAEKDELLHLILAEKLVVLFAKSGMGKTSLLNAGVLQPLRERGFFPIPIRFNDPNLTPQDTVYTAIKNVIALTGIEAKISEGTSLWRYFKTTEFWSKEDVLLTPVLILDQFEDFFDFHPSENRQAFIVQLADVIKGNIPKEVRESSESEENPIYTDTPPNLKVIITIREDFLGEIEELAQNLPGILDNRFRIVAFTREQAQQAIIRPAQLEDQHFRIRSFRYAPETIATMLDFLCKQRKRSAISLSNEVEPFQLQLLCQYVEQIVREKSTQQERTIIIENDMLGGESGMQRVFEDFYDNQIEKLGAESSRRNARNLCEGGLISPTNKRLTLEEEEIIRRFGVSKHLLAELVNNRLLRAEPRLGSIYYELSHDSLVEPIRSSQKRRGDLKLQKAAQYLNLAYSFSPLEDYDNVVENCKKALELDPDNVAAYNFLAFALSRQNKHNEAIENYQRAIQLDPSNANSHNGLGRAFYNQFRNNEAMESYQMALQLDPKHVFAHINIGSLLSEWGEFEEAIKHQQHAIQINPKNADTYNSLGFTFSKQGKYDEAIAYYRQAIQLDPNHRFVYSNLGNALTFKREYEEAIKYHYHALQINPKDAYNGLGWTLYQQGKYDEAIAAYRQAIQLNPKHQYAFGNLAWALTEQGKYEEAIQFHQQAIQMYSQNANAYSGLGWTFYKQGKYDEAIDSYRQALQIDPRHRFVSSTYSHFGLALTEQGNFEEALVYHQKAIDLAPHLAYLYSSLGYTLSQQGKHEQALENYRKALQIDPQEKFAPIGLGGIFSRQHQYDQALAEYQYVIELNPHHARAYTELGITLGKLGRADEAIYQHQKAIELVPLLDLAYYGLGCSLCDLGRYAEAIQNYQKVLELNPARTIAQMSLTVAYLAISKFTEALHLVQKVLEKPHLPDEYQMAMRVLSIFSSYVQNNRQQALTELKTLFEYYRSLPQYYGGNLDYDTYRKVISDFQQFSDADKTLLLKLIDVLQSPKFEGDRKLNELEAALPEIFH